MAKYDLVHGIKAQNLTVIQSVIDYIHQHPWEDLSLHALSRLTSFSPYYFHRLFKEVVQENLYEYIRRVRIDQAARSLIFSDLAISDIAEACGFHSLSSFSRTFKQVRGISPSAFRESYHRSLSKDNSPAVDRFRQRMMEMGGEYPLHGLDHVIAWGRHKIQETAVTHVSEASVIYYRHEGAVLDGINFSIDNLAAKLYHEAVRLNLVTRSSKMIVMTYDDLHITTYAKCRFEVCMTISEEQSRLPKGVESRFIPGGKYAVLSIAEIPTIASFLWELVVQEWLPHSGYCLDTRRPAMEVYSHSPVQDPYARQVFHLYIPLSVNAFF